MVTAYDYTSARIAASGGADIVLVGDSLGQVMHGRESTTPVTMDEMVLHSRSVSRTLQSTGPFIVGDMPFGSYLTTDQALQNAARLVKEGRVDAVKLEGGTKAPNVISHVQSIVEAGIPVMGHIGLTPQTTSALGGYRVQGKTVTSAVSLLQDAVALQDAGCFAIVIEMTPSIVAECITEQLRVPTIGIGAGPNTYDVIVVSM